MKLIGQVALGIALVSSPLTKAAVITQTFDSSWSVDIWDYYGDIAAQEWHYIPYTPWDSSLGNLQSVLITTELSGTKQESQDTIRIRSSFTTGWSPNTYQFSQIDFLSDNEQFFSMRWDWLYDTPEAIASVTDYRYFTGDYNTGAGSGGAWYYFGSRTELGGHFIDARTTLTYQYEPVSVPETSSVVIFGVGLLGLSESPLLA